MLDAVATIVRALLYVGLLSCAGLVFAQFTLPCSAELKKGIVRVTQRLTIVIVGAAAASTFVLILRLGGQFDATTLSAVFSSSVGAALFMQFSGIALLVTSTDETAGRGIRIASAALLTLSLGFNGHAAAEGPFEGMIAFVHLSAAAWWIGSLYLLRYACAHYRIEETATLVKRFGVLAMRVVGALIVTGAALIFSLVEFSEFPALTPYERNLAIKLLFVAAVLGLASYNKFRLTPKLLGGDAQAASSLRRIIDLELIVIGIVLIATAVLTTYTSPHD